jgi:hypothetical protein
MQEIYDFAGNREVMPSPAWSRSKRRRAYETYVIAPGIKIKESWLGTDTVLSAPRNNQIPEWIQGLAEEGERGIYSCENQEWCIPAVVFADEYRRWADLVAPGTANQRYKLALDTMRNWLPAF